MLGASTFIVRIAQRSDEEIAVVPDFHNVWRSVVADIVCCTWYWGFRPGAIDARWEAIWPTSVWLAATVVVAATRLKNSVENARWREFGAVVEGTQGIRDVNDLRQKFKQDIIFYTFQ